MDEKFDNSNIGVSALTGTVEPIDTNGPEARKVLRKIDCHLLPILAVTYFIQVRIATHELRLVTNTFV